LNDNLETDLMHQRWEIEADKLEDDVERFRTYFSSVKKCKCDIAKCNHYKKARQKIFGNRIDDLYNLSLQIGFRVYKETVNSEDDSKPEIL